MYFKVWNISISYVQQLYYEHMWADGQRLCVCVQCQRWVNRCAATTTAAANKPAIQTIERIKNCAVVRKIETNVDVKREWPESPKYGMFVSVAARQHWIARKKKKNLDHNQHNEARRNYTVSNASTNTIPMFRRRIYTFTLDRWVMGDAQQVAAHTMKYILW